MQAAENTALYEQCALLEVELETIRGRAADLSQSLEQAKGELAEQQAEWSTELKQLRQLLERQSHALTSPTPPPAAPPAAALPAAQGADRGAPEDSVVGSVVAQFARLSRERADRRAQGKKG